jgi:hypothetical protein
MKALQSFGKRSATVGTGQRQRREGEMNLMLSAEAAMKRESLPQGIELMAGIIRSSS